ncbi:NitT/TauT family transport system substrate-binding protein [Actinomycetospora succinea]|uniref:NitT/TauT family transport system substrate-binding protein n=1 Tax=Actinomycetospora succinea TaxID=663603 RepID=A0A4R6VPY6_9PSEU|nr:ABC transporter substrate-binding protein [Actinomycetospora succinea]TDQ65401.1 NitT/TauT family transport system substrate-binding protein [Actinomycetospora succinea]
MTTSFPISAAPGFSRRRFLQRAGLAATVGAAAVVVPACSSGAGGGGDRVTFLNVLPLETLSFTPELVASAGGHFAREGLDVQFQTTRGSAQAIQTLIAGSALVSRIGDIETMIAVGERNAPLVNVSTMLQQVTVRMVSAASAPIRTPADFAGKTIGLPSQGGTSETTLDLVLARGGVDPASVQRQVVGLAPGVFDLVVQGRIAAYVASLDTSEQLRIQRPEAVIFNPADVIASGAQLYATSRPQLEDPRSRDLMTRYLRGIRSAVNAVLADPSGDQTLATIRSRFDFPILQDTALAKTSLAAYSANWNAAGPQNLMRTDPARWQATYAELSSAGVMPGGLQPDPWFTNELLGS